MKHIILPSDFSDNAWKAMSYAANLYHNTPCIFHIIHTYNLPTAFSGTGGVTMPVDPIPMSEASANQVEELGKNFKKLDHHSLSTFYSKSIIGSVAVAILDLEDELESTPIIVMGVRGVSGLGKLFFGSVSESVIKQCNSPVICVPIQAILGTPKNIMFAMDELNISSQSEIMPLIELAEEWNSKILTVHINDTEKKTEGKTPDEIVSDFYLNRVEHSYHGLSGNDVEKELMYFADANQIDLIALIKREKGFWKNTFQTSVTKNLTFSSKIPILVLKDI